MTATSAAGFVASVPATPSEGVEVVGEPSRLAAELCRSSGRHLRVKIPRVDSLDGRYRGVLPGLEIRQDLRSGTAGFAHARLTGDVFEIDVWSRGSGISLSAAAEESCGGGRPGDVSFEIVAHYR
jgi:hypothetical protein